MTASTTSFRFPRVTIRDRCGWRIRHILPMRSGTNPSPIGTRAKSGTACRAVAGVRTVLRFRRWRRFLQLSGHVRVPSDPQSTLYNTDGQILSDAGVPVVLFMENYDINRTGYHDTHDTMENIDLDYGAAVCAITIEAVARAASSKDSPLGPDRSSFRTPSR